RIESVTQQGARTLTGFLGRLGDEDDGAVPLVLELPEDAGDADESRHVDVVAAGVHDRDFRAVVAFDGDGAPVRNARVLAHGQGVHVSADGDGGAIAIFHDADYAEAGNSGSGVFADMVGDFAAGGFQFLRDDGGGAFLVRGQFGMRMKILVEGEQRWQL